MTAITAITACLVSATGCYSTTLRSGRPPAREAVFEDWHNVYLFGLIESSGPYDLTALCPEGWAEVSTSTDPWQALLVPVTLAIYLPQTVTVVCATPGSSPAVPKTGHTPAQYPTQLPTPQAIPPVSGPIPKVKTTHHE